MTDVLNPDVIASVFEAFSARGTRPANVIRRDFPNETMVVVEVERGQLETAINLAAEIEATLPPKHILIVRKAETTETTKSSVTSVNDPAVSNLIELLNERSRTSEQQPSLDYIKDAAENLRIAITRRHHLIFGRRGVGKTALLLEGKRQVEGRGAATCWINIQILRGLDSRRAFLTVVQRVCDLPAILHAHRTNKPATVDAAASISAMCRTMESNRSLRRGDVAALVPRTQAMLAQLCQEIGSDIFLFVDDLHYMAMSEQPSFLDLVHGITRDTSTWLKVAGIRNQCRVYSDNPPMGLQTGHDAAEIPLDVTLEDPGKARTFLSDVLQTYLKAAGIANRSGFLSSGALDRLVLASGGVPRDFMLQCARSIQIARVRDNARVVGVQDVNEAAGEAGKQKQAELEDDAAASAGRAASRLAALSRLRAFAIDQHHFSFFRVSLKDKNDLPEEYRVLQSLMDLRMIHLVKSSLSDAHAVGERFEVYLIDLSEYSGSRLKKDLNVIELQGDSLALRKTGKQSGVVVANTARKLVQVFRNGPVFQLQTFSDLVPSTG